MNWLKTLIKHQNQALLRILFLPTLVLIVSLACNIPLRMSSIEEQDQGIVQRTADPTLTADTHGEIAATEPAEAPSVTPSSTTTSPPTFTPTPWVNISGNTNCRFGPGSVYDLIKTYLAGDQALLLGKNAGEDFWYIQDPEQDNLYCWLWGHYATPVGDTASLPVFTPPSTPTPSLGFSIAYEVSDCGAGSCWLWFSITNTGEIPLESVKTYAKNTVTSADATFKSNVFQTSVAGPDISIASLGATVYTHSGQLPNPSGNKVNVNITVCSLDGQSGVCLMKSLSVTP
jgi:hypothetical protein